MTVVRKARAVATEEELCTQHLDVYDTRAGPWNPDHGDIEIPED